MFYKKLFKVTFLSMLAGILLCVVVCVFSPWKTYEWEKENSTFGTEVHTLEIPVFFGEALRFINPTVRTKKEGLEAYLKVVEDNLKTIEDRSGFTKDELLDEKNQDPAAIVYKIYCSEKLRTLKQLENLSKKKDLDSVEVKKFQFLF